MSVNNPTAPQLREFLTSVDAENKSLSSSVSSLSAIVSANKAAQNAVNQSSNSIAWNLVPPPPGFSVFGNGYQQLSYGLKSGNVYFQGFLNGSWPIVQGLVLVKLPPAMRPAALITLPVNRMLFASLFDYRIDVMPSGDVLLYGAGTSGPLYLSLSCSFVLG